MLLGQHWILWSEARQRYVDLSRYLDEQERRWRQLPVMNRLMLWYMLTHARTTENPPVLTYQPGPDQIDADLAAVFDSCVKHVWQDSGMVAVIDKLMAYLLPGGRAHLKSRIDPNGGEEIELIGPAILQLLSGDGQAILGEDGNPIQRETDGPVPFGRDGEPRAQLLEDDDGKLYYDETGEPDTMSEGRIVVDVLSCLEVRAEWGPSDWHDKAWHMQRSFLSPEQAFDTYGEELEPDITGSHAEEVGTLMRMMYGSGLFGAADHRETVTMETQVEYVSIYEFWHRPARFPGMEREGRLMTVTGGGEVLRDGGRFARFKHTSPIRCFDFVSIFGRSQGTSPQEMLNGPTRSRNRIIGQILEHSTKVSNPIMLYDTGAGIDESKVTGRPGSRVGANFQGLAGDPIRFVQPPSLSRDPYESYNMLTSEFDDLGNVRGAEGAPPTRDPSGELVKELRFNSDRFIGPTLRRATIEMARMADDWRVLMPLIWDVEKVISIAGDDEIARTVTVYPELFTEGNINIMPEVESMLPEGRGERQQRVERMYDKGLFGMPGTPEAVNTYLDLARFPHMGRASRMGGVDRSTAAQNVGKLLMGAQAIQIPLFQWYDYGVHLYVLDRHLKSPEYLKNDPQVQMQMTIYRQLLVAAGVTAAQLQMQEQALMQAGAAAGAAAGMAGDPQNPAAAGGSAAPGMPSQVAPGPPDRGPTSAIPSRPSKVANG
jgi:hypothetical protein